MFYWCSILKEKSIFQKIFGYTKVKINEEDLYLV